MGSTENRTSEDMQVDLISVPNETKSPRVSCRVIFILIFVSFTILIYLNIFLGHYLHFSLS
ncbi:hypothetical protein ABEB36_006167 [Hypothenemus hampei]|uniref:Uncharacterized protein n=1 Tax=Hypothenemus hampei TaxID=57062 RepID=A0ABD1EQ18_HYPHA